MSQQVTLEEVTGVITQTELCGSRGNGAYKGLFMTTEILGASAISVMFIVTNKHEEVLSTNDLQHAIRTYNNI